MGRGGEKEREKEELNRVVNVIPAVSVLGRQLEGWKQEEEEWWGRGREGTRKKRGRKECLSEVGCRRQPAGPTIPSLQDAGPLTRHHRAPRQVSECVCVCVRARVLVVGDGGGSWRTRVHTRSGRVEEVSSRGRQPAAARGVEGAGTTAVNDQTNSHARWLS